MRVVLLACLALAAVCEVTFNLHSALLHFLGRNSTLTDRTAVWSDALSLSHSPIFGAGFESFWTGKRLEILWSKWWWHPNQAHDGYLETYLNLGIVGVLLLSGLLLATFSRISRLLKGSDPFARFRMAFLVATVVYNFSEATFKGVALVWTIFQLIAIDLPAEAVPEELPEAATEEELPLALAVQTESWRG
jgi:O-antigen ligase